MRAGGHPPLIAQPHIAPLRRFSEHSNTKCVGITIETRPDYCLKPHLNSMLDYGVRGVKASTRPSRPSPRAPPPVLRAQCTRIEIGVQSVFEDVARDTNRGHTVGAVCHSFSLAKDCGFKVVTHMMPDLPNMGARTQPQRDAFVPCTGG